MSRFRKFFVILAIMTAVFSMTVLADATFSSCWVQDSQGNWKVQYPDGRYVTNAWFCDDAVPSNGKDVWYLLDQNGDMISAGLVKDGTGNYYSLETEHNGYYGMLRYVPGNYGGVNLDLESSHGGAFASIKNDDGVANLSAKYGLTLVNIDNSNCVYSSDLVSKGSFSGAGTVTGIVSNARVQAEAKDDSNDDPYSSGNIEFTGHYYATPSGSCYHYSSECGGKNSREITWETAKKRGLRPCGTCVLK